MRINPSRIGSLIIDAKNFESVKALLELSEKTSGKV